MLHLIPAVKTLKELGGRFEATAIFYQANGLDSRLATALTALPYDKDGAPLQITMGAAGEGYELTLQDGIEINAEGPAGAFYAIQTLRQIFTHKEIPNLYIKDAPDFPYRCFYLDVTRGKIPTTETLKKLIDDMAYYKLNALQLYVEHVYEFEEYKDVIEKTGHLTAAQLKELDDYCADRFISFEPSLSTFGHLFELLNQEKYAHLRVNKGELAKNAWHHRMAHHTIDPLNPESIEIIKSLIDQYEPNFKTDIFNICCDETFDLKHYDNDNPEVDAGRLYIDFVKKIIAHLKGKGKRVMMWADILLEHPEVIEELPEDTIFLSWQYGAVPNEEKIIKFANLGRTQIVCPGTTTWSRLCENPSIARRNIAKMAEYGKKHGAIGVLNTNWGDYANPCSLELAMYGMIWGAEKSWSVNTPEDDAFNTAINHLCYQNENFVELLYELNFLHGYINWNRFTLAYHEKVTGQPITTRPVETANIPLMQDAYKALKKKLDVQPESPYITELRVAAEGLCVLAELSAKFVAYKLPRITNTKEWLTKYSKLWLEKNQPNELYRIEEMFNYCEKN